MSLEPGTNGPLTAPRPPPFPTCGRGGGETPGISTVLIIISAFLWEEEEKIKQRSRLFTMEQSLQSALGQISAPVFPGVTYCTEQY